MCPLLWVHYSPADAVPEVLKSADFVSERNGGNGAVREFIEWIVGNK